MFLYGFVTHGFLIRFTDHRSGSLWSNTDPSLIMINRELQMEHERNESLIHKSIDDNNNEDVVHSDQSNAQLGTTLFLLLTY